MYIVNWNNLSTNRKKLVIIAGVVVTITVSCILIQNKLKQEIEYLTENAHVKINNLSWMKEQAFLVANQRKNIHKNEANNQPLLTTIDQTARTLNIRAMIKRIQPGKLEISARVWFDKIVFEDWLKWLDAIRGSGVSIKQIHISRSGVDHKVNIRVELNTV